MGKDRGTGDRRWTSPDEERRAQSGFSFREGLYGSFREGLYGSFREVSYGGVSYGGGYVRRVHTEVVFDRKGETTLKVLNWYRKKFYNFDSFHPVGCSDLVRTRNLYLF